MYASKNTHQQDKAMVIHAGLVGKVEPAELCSYYTLKVLRDQMLYPFSFPDSGLFWTDAFL